MHGQIAYNKIKIYLSICALKKVNFDIISDFNSRDAVLNACMFSMCLSLLVVLHN